QCRKSHALWQCNCQHCTPPTGRIGVRLETEQRVRVYDIRRTQRFVNSDRQWEPSRFAVRLVYTVSDREQFHGDVAEYDSYDAAVTFLKRHISLPLYCEIQELCKCHGINMHDGTCPIGALQAQLD